MSYPVTYCWFLIVIMTSVNVRPILACSQWVSIDPAQYNRTYMTATNIEANSSRPLGYMSSTVHHNEIPKPCSIVPNTAGNGRHIEILLDIGQSRAVCVNGQCELDRHIGESGTCCPLGNSNRATLCEPVTGNEMKYEFNCQSCEGSQITFWYRIVLEKGNNGTYDENWCATRSADYPSSLQATGSIPVIPTPPGNNPGGDAHHLQYQTKILAFSIACSVVLFREMINWGF